MVKFFSELEETFHEIYSKKKLLPILTGKDEED